MPPTDEAVLSLRFGEHEDWHDPPDVEAFGGRAASSASAAQLDRAEELGVLPGTGPLTPDAPVTLFCQPATHGIPALSPMSGPDDPSPDVGHWCIRPAAFGVLVSVPRLEREPDRSPAARPAARPAVWMVAACLPLLLPAAAAAAAMAEPPPIQRVQRPTLPSAPTEPSESEPESEPEAVSEPDPEPEPDAPSAAPEPPPDAIEVTPPAPPITLEPGIASTDRATLDAAWEGVDGFVVELELKGHQRMVGRVGAVQRDTFTLIQADTGAVLVLPKSGVISLRVQMPPPVPTENGSGALIGGSILTTVGAPVFISGLVFIGICPSCVGLHLPMLFTGGGALAGGITLIARGNRRRRVYREALEQRSMAPVVARTRYGWTGGLRFRF